MSKKKVLTWHVHGSYLYYLTQTDCLFYLPVSSQYPGKTKNFPWGDNVIEVPVSNVKDMMFDCIIFQSNFKLTNPSYDSLHDQIAMLSPYQIKHIPKIFIEHDPPRFHPTDTKHRLFNSDITIVHVTQFNQLMWDCGTAPTKVINHGVSIPNGVSYTGNLERGAVVINNLQSRGRRLGLDIFKQVHKKIPLDLIGMGSEALGGLGEISQADLPFVLSNYRFFFYPARYTSLGLALLEAMMVGLPIVGLSTTQLPTIIQNGQNGYVHTDLEYLASKMKKFLQDKEFAKKLGIGAKMTASKKFGIKRFAFQWKKLIETVSKTRSEKTKKEDTNIYNVPFSL